MRRLNAYVWNLLKSGNYNSFLALEIGPWPQDGSFTRYTTLGSTITLADRINDRYAEFLPNMPIVAVDPPQSSSTVDKNTFKITLADPGYAFRPLLEAGGVNTPMWLRAGLIRNETYGRYVFIPENQLRAPYSGEHGMFYIYKGAVDRYFYTLTEDNDIILTFEGASPAAALEMKRELSTSRNWMRRNYPSDASFDNVYRGSHQEMLQWGKGPPPKAKKRGGIFGKLFG